MFVITDAGNVYKLLVLGFDERLNFFTCSMVSGKGSCLVSGRMRTRPPETTDAVPMITEGMTG